MRTLLLPGDSPQAFRLLPRSLFSSLLCVGSRFSAVGVQFKAAGVSGAAASLAPRLLPPGEVSCRSARSVPTVFCFSLGSAFAVRRRARLLSGSERRAFATMAAVTNVKAGGGVGVSAIEKFVFGQSSLQPEAGTLDKLIETFDAETRRKTPQTLGAESLSVESLPLAFFSPEDAPVGDVPQPQQRLSVEASRAVLLLRVSSLLHAKSGVSPRLVSALCSLTESADEASQTQQALRLPRVSPEFAECQAALVELLRLAAAKASGGNGAETEKLSLAEAALFVGGAAEVAGRLFVCSRVGTAVQSLQILNAAAAAEALLLPRESVEDLAARLASTPALAAACRDFLALLHDAKLQQHRRSAAEARRDCALLADQLAAAASLKAPVDDLAQFVESEAKREQRPPRDFLRLTPDALGPEQPRRPLAQVLSFAEEVALPRLSRATHPARGLASALVASAVAALEATCEVTDLLLAAADRLLKEIPARLEALGMKEEQIRYPLTPPPQLAAEAESQPVLRLTAQGLEAAKSLHRRLAASCEELRVRCDTAPGRGLAFVSRAEDCSLLLQQATALQTSVVLQVLEQQDALQFADAMAKVQRGKKGATAKWAVTAGVRSFVQLLRRVASAEALAASSAGEEAVPFSPSFARRLSWAREFVSLGTEAAALLSRSNCARRLPKAPKGTQDFEPERMVARSAVLEKIKEVFHAHGGLEIDTPVFELRETLLGKYGEDSKLVYDLKDQGGEQLSLRYDLTVPFARYMASHNLLKMRRYHIGKVYRRDEPQMNRGRFREFYQCDFDIAGEAPAMMADAECLSMLVEALRALKSIVGKFVVKVNHRGLLDAIMQTAGLDADKFTAACAAIDKLDKEPWEKVREEMVDVKHIPPQVADKIGVYVQRGGSLEEMLAQLSADSDLGVSERAREVAGEMRLLLQYVRALDVERHLSWEWSLARGLDYYTGIIFEAVMLGVDGGPSPSIAGGGRYDKLVGMFSAKDVPSVGFSVGVERLFALMESRVAAAASTEAPATPTGSAAGLSRKDFTDVLVCHVGEGMLPAVLGVCRQLWDAGVACEFFQGDNARLKKQLDFASVRSIPWVVICGEAERERGSVKVKQLAFRDPTTEGATSGGLEEEVAMKDLTHYLKERINTPALELYRKQLLE